MTIVLDEANFTLVDCLTGKQATRLAVSTKPDLVLLDLNLPDMQGIDVITALREWSEVPIIILSARAADITRVKMVLRVKRKNEQKNSPTSRAFFAFFRSISDT